MRRKWLWSILGGHLLAVCAGVTAEILSGAPTFSVPGAFRDAAARRDLLFLAVGTPGMQQPDVRILRVGADGSTHKAGDFMASGEVRGIALGARHLYLAEGDDGIEIVDVSNPSAARLSAAQTLDGYSHDLALSGDLALVAAGFGGLHILNVSDPGRPRLLSTFQAYPPPQETPPVPEVDAPSEEGLFADTGSSGTNQFGGAGSGGYYFDADDLPALADEDPEEVSPQDIRDREGALDVATHGRYAYLAYGSAGIIIVDISDPDRPRRVGDLITEWPAERLAVQDGVLYVTAGVGGLLLIDVSAPASLEVLGRIRTTCYPRDLAVSRGFAYVADGFCGSDGLVVVDVSDPRAPRVARTLAGMIGSVELAAGHLIALGKESARGFRLAPAGAP